ncbi:MAG: FIST signal transduction protein [Saprospiraceae bacterium]
MKSISIQAASITEVQDTFANLSSDFKPTLAIIFCSIKQNIEAIKNLCNQYDIDFVGCTTAGEIVDDELIEESIAIMLLDINRDFYFIQEVDHGTTSYANALRVGTEIKDTFDNLGLLIMTGGFGVDAASIVDGIKDAIGKEIPMYGGLAGDDLQMQKTLAFSHKIITDKGSIVLAINTDKVEMRGMALSGWEAIGVEKTITKSNGHIIYEIDNERAYDVFTRYFGLNDKSNSLESLVTLQTNYPLQIIRDNDTILRSPLVLNEDDGSITLMGGVKEGDKFRFSNSPGFEVIEQTVEEFQSLKNNAPEADALILFSCKGRHGAFGPLIEDEINGLYNYWEKPMVGFLAYGEIGNTPNGVCEFHNETCSLVTLKEK